MPRFDQPIEPMTLGNMRELGVRSHQPDRSLFLRCSIIMRCRRGNPGDMVRFMSQVRGGDFSGSPSRRGPSCGYSVGPFHFN
jgi:hypothetical protein